MEPIHKYNLAIVWEFYVILLIMDWFVPLPTIHIWGKNVMVECCPINDTLWFPNHFNITLEANIIDLKLK